MTNDLNKFIEKLGGNTDNLKTNLNSEKYNMIITCLDGNLNELKTELETEKLDKIISLYGGDINSLKTNLKSEKFNKIIELLGGKPVTNNFIKELVSLLPNLIELEVEGENISVNDSTASNCKIELKGNTYQEVTDTSPSPEYPSEIRNVKGNIEIELSNKNFFKLEDLKKSDESWIVPAYKLTLKLKPNTQYTCSSNVPFYNGDQALYFNGQTWSGGAGVCEGTSRTTTTDENGNLFIAICHNRTYGKELMNGTYYIQIEEGNIATDYTPHKKQILTFPLDDKELMEDSYLANDGIHHKRKKIVLDGTENFGLYPNTTNSFMLRLPYISANGISTHYKSIKSSLFDTEIGMYVDNSIYFIISDIRFSTIEEFKTYLAEQYLNGTPVTLEFIMLSNEDRTPVEEIIPYTKEQQIAWNQLKMARTYYGGTNVKVISDTIKPTIKLTYKQMKGVE